MTALLADIPLEPAGVPRGRAMVERAEWAARAFATFDIESVRRIAKAAAEAGEKRAADFADVSRRVVARIQGLPVPGVPERDEPFVLIAHDLAPADILDRGAFL